MLDVWPVLSIVIRVYYDTWGVDNIIATLQHSNRICQLELIGTITSPEMDEILVAMQQPFPELKRLKLQHSAWSRDKAALLPSSTVLYVASPLRAKIEIKVRHSV